MGFPILNLPLVAFRDILKILDFKDLISISFCSKECHNRTKRNLYKLKNWEIRAVVCWYSGIIFKKGDVEHRILEVCLYKQFANRRDWRSRIQFCQGFHVAMNWSGSLTSFWLNKAIGMYETWKYVTELFQRNVDVIKFQNDRVWAMYLPMMFPQTPVPKTHFQNDGKRCFEKVALARILEDCSTEHLKIVGCFFRDFHFVRFGNFRTFETCIGKWITVCHLTRMKCSKISIGFSRWNNSDANKFLRHWIYRSGMPNLEWLNIGFWCVGHVREDVILDGLGEFVTRTNNRRRFEKYDEDFTFNGLEIRSKSGSVASIHVDINSRKLRMAVWKGSNLE